MGIKRLFTFARTRAVCADCQHGQGRACACRARRSRRLRMSDTAWLWVLIVLDVAGLVGMFALVRMVLGAWS